MLSFIRLSLLLYPLVLLDLHVLRVVGQGLSDNVISSVKQNLAEAAQESWEFGTRAQALLELDTPTFSVFSSKSLPPPTSGEPTTLSDVFSIARNIVANRSDSNGNVQGPQPLLADASAGDPASIGVAVLLANWTGQNDQDYGQAATDQLNYLFQNVPQTSDGAISHRVNELQLWSDFVYMVPPFLAYYGVTTQNQTLVQMAYTQIKLYRNYLRDTSANSLWKHIIMGSFTDEGHWSTGNGWAAAGMLRVLATIQRSSYANQMKSQQSDLSSWVQEIHNAMYPHLNTTSYLFTNYADQGLSDSNFFDASSTTLLAATVFRLSIISGVHTHIPLAEKCREVIFGGNSSEPAVSSSVSSAAISLSSFLSTQTGGPITISTAVSGNTSVTSSAGNTSVVSSAENTSATSSSTSVHQRKVRETISKANSTTASFASSATLASAHASSSASATSTSPVPSSTAPTYFTSSENHIDQDGWLNPVVDPDDFTVIGSHSAEGQAFVLELDSAWRDWLATGAQGKNGAGPRYASGGLACIWSVVVAASLGAGLNF